MPASGMAALAETGTVTAEYMWVYLAAGFGLGSGSAALEDNSVVDEAAKHPNAHQVTSLQAIAHGSNSVQYFQWRQSRGGEEKFHGAVVNHLGSEDTRVFKDVSQLGATLANITEIATTHVPAQVAVIYDFENGWALNRAQLPRNLDKNYQETCIRHYGGFWQHGIPTAVIESETDFTPYRLIVAPMLYMLRPNVAERIEAFVKSGGTFITTYLAGSVNESDLCFLKGYPPALRRTLGIISEELDTLTNEQIGKIIACEGNALNLNGEYQFHHYAELVRLETAQPLAVYDSEFYKGYPALTVNAHGAGQAYFISARMDDPFLNAFYGALADEHHLDKAFSNSLSEGISAQVRENDDFRYIFLMNFTCEDQVITLDDSYTDLITKTSVNDPISLQPYGSIILKQTKTRSSS
jgi:beta-galactosidase